MCLKVISLGFIGIAAPVAMAQSGAAPTNPVDFDKLRDARAWSTFAGGPTRVAVAPVGTQGPSLLTSPRFVFDGDDKQNFVFYGQTAVAMTDELVIAIGYESDFFGIRIPGEPGNIDTDANSDVPDSTTNAGQSGFDGATTTPDSYQQPVGSDVVVAFSRSDGSLRWVSEVPIALLDSWSAPCVDIARNSVLVATGTKICAISLDDGSELWRVSLDNLVVNATPVVTDDLPGRNRAFITDHSFASGAEGNLFCINVDPYHPTLNPYKPGELVWIVDLDGQTSGSTPAYRDGLVYVATASGGSQWDQGTIQAIPANTDSPPLQTWVYEHTAPAGFFSGVAVTNNGVYASSYSFTGDQFSAQTVRLNRYDGQQVWSVPTNRTDTTPVPFGDQFVLVSGGVPFSSQFPAFGSLPSLQLIVETSFGAAARVWDSALDTLDDTNHNYAWDPGEDFLSLGGWTIQPAVLEIGGKHYAYVGTTPDPTGPDGFFGASPELALIDLSKHPADHGFVVQWGMGSGASPALAGTELYTVGAEGVFAYGAPAMPIERVVALWTSGTLPDYNADGVADLVDLGIAMEHAQDR
ncbi:MAG: PQQ-binding-like beta-propeller repeat protein [Phycisphaerales bacterium]